MITISKAKLEQDMKGYLRLVEEKGEELILTDNQVPVLKVVPFYLGKLQQTRFFGTSVGG